VQKRLGYRDSVVRSTRRDGESASTRAPTDADVEIGVPTTAAREMLPQTKPI